MRRPLLIALLLVSALPFAHGADDYKPGPGFLPQLGLPKGMMLKDKYTSHRIAPGTERGVSVCVPAGLDRSRPAPSLVSPDGLIHEVLIKPAAPKV